MQLRALEKVSCFVIPAAADAVHAETQSAGNRCRTAELLLEQQISVLRHFNEDNAVERLRIYTAKGRFPALKAEGCGCLYRCRENNIPEGTNWSLSICCDSILTVNFKPMVYIGIWKVTNVIQLKDITWNHILICFPKTYSVFNMLVKFRKPV